MIYKIIRKLGMGKTALSFLRPFTQSAVMLPSLDDASKVLQAHSPDPGTSCLCERKAGKSGEYDLDIIIPAYNVEKYIARCVDSVLSQQTGFTYRLIIVDDGSTDKTPQLVDSYGELENVTVIHQENRGFSGARNVGLELSTAGHIMFLDSDDTLCPGAIDALMKSIKEGAAIAVGGFNSVNPEGKVLSSCCHKSGLLNIRQDLMGYPWGKIFVASLFEGICLPEGYWYEDSLMAQVIYPLAERQSMSAAGLTQPVYNYTINPAGITANSRKRPKCIDSLWITLQLYKDRQSLGLEKDQQYYEYILNMIVLSYRRTEQQSEEIKKAMFVLWQDFILREFSGFDSAESKKKILQQAVREGNFKLYCAACKLI